MKFIGGFLLLFLAVHVHTSGSPVNEDSYQITLDLPQPGKNGVRHNDYLCRSASLLNTDGYIVRYEPRADPRIAHHMLLYGCSRPAHTRVNSWSCKSGSEICEWGGTHEIIFAWALNASGIVLPEGVGLQVGPSRNINYVVLQIHYGHPEDVPNLQAVNQEALTLHLTTNRQPYVSGIFLLGSGRSIAPHKEASYLDSACEFHGPKTIHPFAFRTHAHSLGRQIAGYIVKGGRKWELIGTRSPQDPQAFYSAEGSLEVDVGDWLAVRCVFNTQTKAQAVHIGPDSEDEMCNFYIMYYTENDGHHLSRDSCWSPAPSSLHYPTLPSLPPPTHIHHHENVDKGGEDGQQDDNYICASPVPPGPPPRICRPVTTPTNTTPSLSGSSSSPPRTPPPSTPPPSTPPPSTPPPSTPPPSTPSPSTPPPNTPPPATAVQETPGQFFEGEASPPSPEGSQTGAELVPAEDWPLNGVSIPGIALGQVSAVAVDHEGFVHILHRGPVVWDGNSFSSANVYRHMADGPIAIPTIVKLTSIGQPKRGWGTSVFYMPHGLTVDLHGHFWVTDVAMHQVFKFNEEGDASPSLTLGTAFVPGTGRKHFCKPAAVAVESSGIFYVADGYCNKRIIKYSAAGNILEIWDQPVNNQRLFIPHSLALSSSSPRKLFVADRENHRIISYDTTSGNAEVVSDSAVLRNRVFAISFNGSNRWPLYGVFGPRLSVKESEQGPVGFTVNKGGQLARTWGPERVVHGESEVRSSKLMFFVPQGFSRPHDLAVDPVHNAVYVAEIGPNRIWKFVPVITNPLDVLDNFVSSHPPTTAATLLATSNAQVTSPPTEHPQTTIPSSSPSSLNEEETPPTAHESGTSKGHISTSPPQATSSLSVTTEGTTAIQSVVQDIANSHLPGVLLNSTSNATEDKASENSNPQHTDPVVQETKAAYSYGIFAGILVVLLLIILVVVGILKEHKNLRYSLRYGCRKKPPKQRRLNPRKTLDSLLGPSQLGFSRLRTYDSDSEVDEFPIFSRV